MRGDFSLWQVLEYFKLVFAYMLIGHYLGRQSEEITALEWPSTMGLKLARKLIFLIKKNAKERAINTGTET